MDIIKDFTWDGFMQTFLNNTTEKERLTNFEYNNDSLYVKTKSGLELCKIGKTIIKDSANNYYIM